MIPRNQDDYLAEGYFRAGHTIRRTRYVFVGGETYSTIWSRVPLRHYTLSKSQRKLQRRILRDYTVTAGPYEPAADQDALYARYQTAHPLDVAESVDEVLGFERPVLSFETYCLRIEDGDELIAFSCFDLGDTTAASLFGCYAPERARESLGFATMLLEMAFAKTELHLDYYYPGYCVPGHAPFDYKMRLPDLEGKTWVSDAWTDFGEVLAAPLPHRRISACLAEVAELLSAAGLAAREVVMPLAENFYSTYSPSGPLPHVQMLAPDFRIPLGELFVGYDPHAGSYELWLASVQVDIRHEEAAAPWLDDLPTGADLRLYNWRVPVHVTTDPATLLRFLQPGALVARLVSGVKPTNTER